MASGGLTYLSLPRRKAWRFWMIWAVMCIARNERISIKHLVCVVWPIRLRIPKPGHYFAGESKDTLRSLTAKGIPVRSLYRFVTMSASDLRFADLRSSE